MAIHFVASRARLTRALRSLRPNDIPLRHRFMLIDRSTSSADEPVISFCRLPQRLLFLHVQGEIGFGSRNTLRGESGSTTLA